MKVKCFRAVCPDMRERSMMLSFNGHLFCTYYCLGTYTRDEAAKPPVPVQSSLDFKPREVFKHGAD